MVCQARCSRLHTLFSSVAGDRSGNLIVTDTASGAEIWKLKKKAHDGHVTALEWWDVDGEGCASGCFVSGGQDGYVRVRCCKWGCSKSWHFDVQGCTMFLLPTRLMELDNRMLKLVNPSQISFVGVMVLRRRHRTILLLGYLCMHACMCCMCCMCTGKGAANSQPVASSFDMQVWDPRQRALVAKMELHVNEKGRGAVGDLCAGRLLRLTVREAMRCLHLLLTLSLPM
jgi:WD40 repeat protein